MKTTSLAILSWVCLILAGPRAWAIRPPAQEPLANFDKRTAAAAPAAGPAAAVAALQARLPKARVDFEIITGSPKMVSGTDGFLTGPDGHGGGVSAATAAQFAADDPHRATKAFLQEHRALFGHGPEVLQPARLLRQYVTPHNGLNTVVWEQQVDGIGVFEAVLISHTTRQGELVNLSSQFVPDPVAAAAQGTPNRAALLAAPGVSARQALALAGQNTGEQFRAEEAAAAGPVEAGLARRQKFTAPGLKGPAGTQLLWLPMDRDHLRLCWDVVLMSRRRGEMFRLLVDARTGEVLFRRCLTQYLTEATFRVYTNDSPSPFSPGFSTPQTNQPPVVPRSLVTLAALDTNASPAGWIPDGGNETLGNNVDAHTDRNNDDRPDLPRPHGAPSRVFDFPMDLATQDPTNYAAAAVVQLFYTCNWMHDRLYELGFTEAAGIFQTSNFGRGGLEDDAVLADAQDGSGTDNANFSTPPDGQPGRMQMYIFTGPRPRRDGDFDAEIVLHEYTHGLSGRLVGGGQGLGTLQSDGMGEGWSDFYGLALLSQPGDDVDGVYAAGAYASYRIGGSNDTENYYFGIRRYPYTTDLTKNPLTFKDIDPAQADYCASGAPYHTGMFGACSSSMANEVHNQGEVWCATLWEARAALVRKYGWALGNPMILQLVTDGMKLTPAQPNFLQARDAILQADRVNNGGANLAQLWAAFAKRGMGFSAESPASTTTTGVAESFDLPDDLLILPKTALSFSGPVAGPFQPTVQSYVLTNQGPNPVVWRATADQPWLNLAPATGTLAVGGPSVEVTVWLDRVAGEIPAGTFTNLIHFTNATTGVSQLRRVVLGCRDQDSLTELFSRDDFDLAYRTLTFSPDGSPQFYAVCSQPATQFPTDPSGGVLVSLGDDGSAAVTLSGGRSVMFYGVPTNTFYIGGNGYLTFDSGDWTYAETLASHFNQRRISAFFHDLYSDGSARVSWKQLGDRVAVTYQNIRDYNAWAWNNFQIELFFAGRIRITYLMMESQSGLVGLSRGQGVPAGFVESDFSSHTVCLPALTLALPASANEGAGVLVQAGRLAVPSPLATNLTVLLQSSDPSELLVPPAVLLPAGATSVTFDVTVLDDAAFDGGRRPYVVASAPGFLDGAASLLLYDNETAVLSVRLPSSVTEGDAPTQAVVQVSAAPATSVLVTLECSNPSELRVQPFAIIPAGQTSAVFSVEAVDDTWIDGDQRVTVSAQVPGWISGAASLVVHDNESTNLTVELPVAVTEGQGLRPGLGTVRFAGTVVSNVVVGLESSDSSELMVPASVTVFSGASWASFDLTVLDDAAADGPQTVQVTARAPGFQDGTTSLVVNDNEQPLPPFSPQPPNLASHVAAQVVLSWVSTDGDLLLNGGFETGDFTGWTRAFGGSGNFVINNGSYDPPGPEGPTPPFEGRFSALAQQTGPAVMQIFQDVHLPPEATFAQLAWRQRIHNYAASYDYDQGLWVDILTPQGSWLAEAFGTTSATPLSNDWTAQQFDLTPFLGQTVRIVFTVYNQDTNLNVHLDDIGVRLSSTTPSLYSVFFGTNAALGPAQLLGSTTNTLWPLPLLDPLTPYYWQVVAQRGLAVTGAVWQFTTRGPNHFDWSDIASPQYVNTPFTVSLTARDEFNRVVTNFTGPLDLAAVASQKTLLLFGDDFEDGDFDGWDVGSGAYARAVTDQTAATGEYSFTQLGGDGSHLNGVSHSLAGLRPDRVSFYVRAQTNNLAGGYFVLDDGSGAFGIAVFFFMSNDGQMGLYEDQDGWLAVPYDAGRWYKISLAFDWQNQAVDYLVDDQLRFAAIPFRNPVDALGTVYLYNFDSTQAWWDDIRFENPFLLGLSPTRATPITAGRWMGAATVLDPINAVHLTATDDLGHVSPSASFAVLLRDDAGLQAFGSPEVVAIGRPVTYTLLVTNTGPSSATGVWVTNLCPAAAEILSATASQGSFTQAGQAVLFNLGSLASGATATLTVRITPLAGGLLTNTAALARQETDLYAPNNIASVVTVVLPQLSLTDATVVEGNLGVTGAVFTVTLSAPLDRPVSFDYATADGTAQAGRDYLAQSGRLVLPPGVLSTQVIVAVLGDVRVEPDETFYLNLSHPVNVTLGRTQALGAILNDDGLPGEIAAVAWGAISSPQQVNHPFAVTLTALDAAGRLASNFNGTVALSAWQSVPETNLIGTRSSDASFPLGGGNQVQRTQVIYLAEELGAAGQIMSLALDVSSAPSLTTLSNWTIRLKHTSLSSCEFGTWEATDWTLVYQTNLSVSGAQTLTFTLPTPFNYNGADNLMVDFSFNHTTTASARYCWTTSQNSVRR